ncbi:MAG: transposase, partial [Gammaproteobacteria bacterium]|nr:transposase [Gammaproteobacteria bacterium]
MPRIARIVIPNCPHHVTQRGNNHQDVFFVDDDQVTYLGLLKDESERYGVRVDGYCLMTNHIHLIVTPESEDSLAKAFGRTHFRYTQYINRFHKRSGHLWQNRFYSCALDDDHFWAALAYVEQNPVRARMVRRPWRYDWSSAAAHCGLAKDSSELLGLAAWQKLSPGDNW